MEEVQGGAVWFHTFGCKANQYDTERMRQELESRGAYTVSEPGLADVAILNSCTVTNRADADARSLVRRLRRRHPQLQILVAGCSAALREADYRSMAEVDVVVGGQDPVEVAEALREVVLLSPGAVEAPLRTGRRGTRAWLKVQDGCDRKCSFCATRLARGISRSRSPDEVLREARILARAHPELVITGIHIGHYGYDLPEPTTLGRLAARLLDELPGTRVRLGSIEATEIDDTLVELLCHSGGQLAPHLHVPLQSGSDEILRLMRRWHTRQAYRERLLEIVERLPVLGLGADIIVGFPGEGEEEFAATRALVEELPFNYLHVFPYSVRDGTAAAELPGRVSGSVAAKRSRELRELVRRKGEAYRAARVGQESHVVVEGRREVSGGLTGDYLRVEVRGTGVAPGDLIRATLRGSAGGLWVSAKPVRDRATRHWTLRGR